MYIQYVVIMIKINIHTMICRILAFEIDFKNPRQIKDILLLRNILIIFTLFIFTPFVEYY